MSADSMPRVGQLVIIRTSAACASYRLYERQDSLTAPERLVWSNRVYPTPEGDAGARGRAAAWAQRNGYQIVERKEEQRKRA